jgi:hypothetical protein
MEVEDNPGVGFFKSNSFRTNTHFAKKSGIGVPSGNRQVVAGRDLGLYFAGISAKPDIHMTRPLAPSAARSSVRPGRRFYHRFLIALGLASVLITFSLGLGILGYHFFADLGWVDSLLNASMILTGMGPVNTLNTDGAKLFASAYALFSGVVFITATGILLSPIFHRVLVRFHIEQRDLH